MDVYHIITLDIQLSSPQFLYTLITQKRGFLAMNFYPYVHIIHIIRLYKRRGWERERMTRKRDDKGSDTVLESREDTRTIRPVVMLLTSVGMFDAHTAIAKDLGRASLGGHILACGGEK